MPESLLNDQSRRPRKRSRAWIYYAILTAVCVVGAFSTPITLIPAALCAGYSRYIYGGGRFVIWFW